MSCSGQMKKIFQIGNIPFYYAGKGFMYKGIWIWNGKKNIRILPFNKFFKKIKDE